MPLLAAIAALGVLIFVHELGHFAVAKLFGILVERFSLGFGPKVVGIKAGETEYVLSAVPLGGYVKMLGEGNEEIPEDLTHRSFSAKPIWQRSAVVLAGPLANILFACLLVYAVNIAGTPALVPKVGKLVPDGAAQKAGLKPGDLIKAINQKPIHTWEEMAKIIHSSPGKRLILTVARGNQTLQIPVVPAAVKRKNIFGEEITIGLIGIYPSGEITIRKYGPLEAIPACIEQTYNMVALTVKGIVKLIQRKVSVKNLGGPILIVQMAKKQAQSGLLQFLLFVAFISVNLGVINLLPIPVLDGGHLLFFAVEGVTKRPLSQKAQEMAQQVGLAILILIMVLAMYNDIMRILAKRLK